MYSLALITAPTTEPISVADAKKQLELATSYTAHDQHLAMLITAARQYVENHTGLAICTQTWDYTFDRWPSSNEPIYLPKSPVASITSVKYYDQDGSQQTWSSGQYVVNVNRNPAVIRIQYGYTWPTYRAQPDSHTIRMVCGYGATTTSAPAAVRQALLLLVSHWFEQRTPEIVGTTSNNVAHALDALLMQYRMPDEFIAYAEAC